MNRRPDWEHQLTTFVEERRELPFKWGQNDCCLFAADGVERVTGYDFAEDFRETYCTPFGALHQLTERGARNVEELLELMDCIGFREQPVFLAQRGDVVTALLDPELGPALGLNLGVKAAFVSFTGLVFLPITSCRRSWAI